MSDAAGAVPQSAASAISAAPAASAPSGAVQPSAETKQMIRGFYLKAFGLLRSGSSEAHTAAELQTEGLDPANAARLATTMAKFLRQMRAAYRQAGLKAVGVGALMCVVGIVITAVTFAMASGGGTYFVAWGAVIFGAIQAIKGLVTCARQPSESDVIRAFNL